MAAVTCEACAGLGRTAPLHRTEPALQKTREVMDREIRLCVRSGRSFEIIADGIVSHYPMLGHRQALEIVRAASARSSWTEEIK